MTAAASQQQGRARAIRGLCFPVNFGEQFGQVIVHRESLCHSIGWTPSGHDATMAHEEPAMPEYLAPGVYVEESDAGVTPIPGVSTSTIDVETARALVCAIEPVIKRAQPGWTGFNDADPGIALIQFFAWVAEGLLYRSSADSERRRKAVLSAVADVAAVARACAIERKTLRRPNYFVGKLIDAADLQLEQEYHLEKHRRHNRHLHGFGI